MEGLRVGYMTHYLGNEATSAKEWNLQVDGFNVEVSSTKTKSSRQYYLDSLTLVNNAASKQHCLKSLHTSPLQHCELYTQHSNSSLRM
jgi:hypothetical protein